MSGAVLIGIEGAVLLVQDGNRQDGKKCLGSLLPPGYGATATAGGGAIAHDTRRKPSAALPSESARKPGKTSELMASRTQPGPIPAPDKKEKKESFRDHLPAVVAAASGAILSAILGSFLGKAGTLIGLAAGSMISGSVTWWVERGIRKSAAIARAKREAIRKKGRPLTTGETALIERVIESQPRWKGIHWRWIAFFTAAALIFTAASVTTVEALSGKTLFGLLKGNDDKGFTIGRSYVPTPTVTRYVTPPASRTSYVTVSPTAVPDFTPDAPGSSSESPAPIVTVTASPSSSTPSPLPDSLPGTTSAPAEPGVITTP
jgi:hypothetical protein